MLFVWKKYLELASHLITTASSDQCDPEANYRAAISRSYYAAHCTLREYLIREGKIDIKDKSTNEKIGVHEQVIRALSDYGIKTLQSKIAANLRTMREKRVQADYKPDYFSPPTISKIQHDTRLKSEANGCIRMAESIFQQFEKLTLTSPEKK